MLWPLSCHVETFCDNKHISGSVLNEAFSAIYIAWQDYVPYRADLKHPSGIYSNLIHNSFFSHKYELQHLFWYFIYVKKTDWFSIAKN